VRKDGFVALVLSETALPLTPALSLRERENRRPGSERSGVHNSTEIGKSFIRSPKERVRMRGKRAPNENSLLVALASISPQFDLD